jgi:DNA helicase-2/ATP-dependent DNA helicase PcrA
MAEERRLFYVGITRAKNYLILVRAGQRSSYGRFDYTQQSRFLEDIPEGLLKREGVRLGVRSVNPLSQPRWQPWSTSGFADKTEDKPKVSGYKARERNVNPIKQPRIQIRSTTGLSSKVKEPPKETRYKAGMRVIHPVWGDGMVVETRLMGSDETVTVVFETVGLKKLAASLAKLEIISK